MLWLTTSELPSEWIRPGTLWPHNPDDSKPSVKAFPKLSWPGILDASQLIGQTELSKEGNSSLPYLPKNIDMKST